MNIKYIVSTISFKIIVPIILIFIVVMSIAFTRMNLANIDLANIKSSAKINSTIKQIKLQIEAAENTAVYSSSIFSDLSVVKSAYRILDYTDDIDSVNTILRKNVESNIENTIKNIGFKPKVQFYVAPARSLYKSWSNVYGEDLSSEQAEILDVSRNHNPIKGVSVCELGLVVRGIVPVFDNNNYKGAVETIFPFGLVIEGVIDNLNTDVAIFVYDEKLQHEDSSFYGYTLLNSSADYSLSSAMKLDIVRNNKSIQYISTDKYAYAFMAILDEYNNNIGLVSVQEYIGDNAAVVRLQLLKNIIFAFFVIMIVIIVVRWRIFSVVVSPIDTLAADIDLISKGKLIDNIKNDKAGVIWTIYRSYNVMIDRLKATTEFANQIGEGNLDVNLDNIHKEDVLGHSLIRMKNNLVESEKIEKDNKKEEEKRNWATKGFADFSEILRQTNSSIEDFSTNIITSLVKYTNSNQGGLFILNNNEDPTLELTASYAYNRRKYIDKVINIGEGLVGLCAIEKETIFLTEIPDDYINISSGLGESNPRCIVIIPLKLEDKIFGVLELASFSVYEDYQIKFLEELGESIASTLSVSKTNILTKELLEQSQQQQEEMSAQEEEMRQNLEEMQTTQEAFLDTEAESKYEIEIMKLKQMLESQKKDFLVKENELLERIEVLEKN